MTKHYLCGTDYRFEMSMGQAFFCNTLEELKNESKCIDECGIVEILLDEFGNEISSKWIQCPFQLTKI